jgi:hypothetical protein
MPGSGKKPELFLVQDSNSVRRLVVDPIAILAHRHKHAALQREDPFERAVIMQEQLFTEEENAVYHAARRAWRAGQGVPWRIGLRTAGEEKQRCSDRNR